LEWWLWALIGFRGKRWAHSKKGGLRHCVGFTQGVALGWYVAALSGLRKISKRGLYDYTQFKESTN